MIDPVSCTAIPAGRAAATAVRDADLLADRLLDPHGTTVPLAVRAYEQRMPAYAADAVRASPEPITWMRRRSAPWTRTPARIGLAMAAAGSRLRGR